MNAPDPQPAPAKWRAEMRDRVRALLAPLTERRATQAEADELEATFWEAGPFFIRTTLRAIYGDEKGEVAFADMTGQLDVSDADLARRWGTSQQAVSKFLGQIRRAFGLPPRCPNNARHRHPDQKKAA